MKVRTHTPYAQRRLIFRIPPFLHPQWRVDLSDQLLLAVVAGLLFAVGSCTSFLSTEPPRRIFIFFLFRFCVLLRGGIFTKLQLKLLGHGICYLVDISVQVNRRLLLLSHYALDAVHLFRCKLDSLH